MSEQEYKEACQKKYIAYMENVWAFVHKVRIMNPYTGKNDPPDEDLMRSIEEQVGVPEMMADDFRRMMVVESARPKPLYKMDDPHAHELESAIGEVVTREMGVIQS